MKLMATVKRIPLSRFIYRKVGKIFEEHRLRAVKSIPQYKLEQRHCEGSRVLANRAALLEVLPANGVVAELGSDKGDFSDSILTISKPKLFHIVDIWGSSRYGEDKARFVKNRFRSEIDSKNVKIHRKISTEATADFDDNYFDWIYIDTDHSYNTTIRELYLYANKVKFDGYIAGHDYTMGNWVKSYKYGVIEAIAEFCVKENWKIAYLTADHVEGNSFAIKRL